MKRKISLLGVILLAFSCSSPLQEEGYNSSVIGWAKEFLYYQQADSTSVVEIDTTISSESLQLTVQRHSWESRQNYYPFTLLTVKPFNSNQIIPLPFPDEIIIWKEKSVPIEKSFQWHLNNTISELKYSGDSVKVASFLSLILDSVLQMNPIKDTAQVVAHQELMIRENYTSCVKELDQRLNRVKQRVLSTSKVYMTFYGALSYWSFNISLEGDIYKVKAEMLNPECYSLTII